MPRARSRGFQPASVGRFAPLRFGVAADFGAQPRQRLGMGFLQPGDHLLAHLAAQDPGPWRGTRAHQAAQLHGLVVHLGDLQHHDLAIPVVRG